LPAESTETRVVVLVSLSRTKISKVLLVSPGTMLEVSEENATNRPSAEMEGWREPLFPKLPAESIETGVIVISPHI
jgi:hypothetical protein